MEEHILFFPRVWGKGQAYRLALAKAAWADCTTSRVPCLGKKAVRLQHSFQLSCGCVFHFSTRICAHNVGQWHLGVALFALKCQLEWVMSWQENRDVWLRRLWNDTDLLLGPWEIIKARGRETLKRFWPGQIKCKWKSRGPQGPGEFRPGLIRQGWKNWEYLTRREDDRSSSDLQTCHRPKQQWFHKETAFNPAQNQAIWGHSFNPWSGRSKISCAVAKRKKFF